MGSYIFYGDNVETIDGARAKNQTLTVTSTEDFSSYLIFGDAGYLKSGARGGNDVIFGKSGGLDGILDITNIICGDWNRQTFSSGGNDEIFGGNNVKENYLYGDASIIYGGKGGNDQLSAGANAQSNILFGDAEIMCSIADENGKTYASRGGNDVLIGAISEFGNKLIGDALSGFGSVIGGNDRLVSGEGDDAMWGDFEYLYLSTPTFGHDTFVFKSNNGKDTIFDFRSGDDKIELSGMTGIDEFSDLLIGTSSGGTCISFADGGSITLIGVDHVQAQDFIFS